MTRISSILSFLELLAANNNREWFAAHKELYTIAIKDFTALTDELIAGISSFDPSLKGVDPASCIFRIYRDARFSKDKSPYKTNFGAFMLQGGKKAGGAGYYFHLQPGECFLAGGVWMPDAAALKKIRDEIVYSSPEFLQIMNHKEIRRTFGELDDISLKKIPAAFPADLPVSDFLRYKSFTVSAPFDPKMFKKDEELLQYITGIFKRMLPLNKFLGRALSH